MDPLQILGGGNSAGLEEGRQLTRRRSRLPDTEQRACQL
jgi:hypothetical protein